MIEPVRFPAGTARPAAMPALPVPRDLRLEATEHALVVYGSIDVRSAGPLRAALHTLIDRHVGAGYAAGGYASEGDRSGPAGCGTDGWRAVARLDLSDADIRDATGLGVLALALTRARRAHVGIQLVGATPRTWRLLRRSRLDRLLAVDSAAARHRPVAAQAALVGGSAREPAHLAYP